MPTNVTGMLIAILSFAGMYLLENNVHQFAALDLQNVSPNLKFSDTMQPAGQPYSRARSGGESRQRFRDSFQGVTMSDDDVKRELERLRSENAALKKGAATGITMKVSEKGGLSVYGMGRFPITLYKEQWLKLLDMSDAIRAFIAANEATLKVKG